VLWVLRTGEEDSWDPLQGTSSPAGTKIKRHKDILKAISNHYVCLILLLNTFKSQSSGSVSWMSDQ